MGRRAVAVLSLVACASCAWAFVAPQSAFCLSRFAPSSVGLRAASDPLFLCQEHVDIALEEAKAYFKAVFHQETEIRMSGDVKCVDIDGPTITLRLQGMFWHSRPVVFQCVSDYVRNRIPEIVQIDAVSTVNLEDGNVQSPDFNGDRQELERLGYEDWATVIIQHRPGLTFTGYNI